jgi:hypothetical protein
MDITIINLDIKEKTPFAHEKPALIPPLPPKHNEANLLLSFFPQSSPKRINK